MISTSWDYAKKISETTYLLTTLLFDNLIIPLITSELIVLITDGRINLIKYYIMIQIISQLLNDFFIVKMISVISHKIKKIYLENQIRKYDTLSFADRRTKTASGFNQISESASWSVYLMIDWGVPSIMNLIGTIVGVLYTCMRKGLLVHLSISVGVIMIIFYLVIRPRQKNYTTEDKAFKKIRNTINEKTEMYLIPFQYKEYRPDHIITQKNIVLDEQLKNNNNWQIITGLTSSTNYIVTMTICYTMSNNVTDFMLVMFTMNQLSRAISQVNNFITQFNRIKNDYDNMEEFWSNCTFKKESKKIQLKESIHVINFEVDQGSIKLKLDKNFGNWILKPDSKMLWYGPTGHGKSTLKKALFGLIDSKIKLSNGKPKNYYHLVADYYQEIKEKTPSSKTSLRDYFKGEQCNSLIEEYLKFAWNDRYDNIITAIDEYESKNNKQKIEIISMDTNNTHIHPYDKPLNEILSGGEKSRLILVTRGYEIDKFNKTILVLDEPCPDVDHDTYIEIMNKFFEKYNRCMIIMIAHLCKCKRSDLKINWNIEIEVRDGIVYRRK